MPQFPNKIQIQYHISRANTHLTKQGSYLGRFDAKQREQLLITLISQIHLGQRRQNIREGRLTPDAPQEPVNQLPMNTLKDVMISSSSSGTDRQLLVPVRIHEVATGRPPDDGRSIP